MMKVMIEYLAGRPVRTEQMGQVQGGPEVEKVAHFSWGPTGYAGIAGGLRPFRAGRSAEQARSIEQ